VLFAGDSRLIVWSALVSDGLSWVRSSGVKVKINKVKIICSFIIMKKNKILEFLKGEFIGKIVEIIESENKSLVGIKGRIVNETKNMFVIETGKGEKKVQKKICKFRFSKEGIVVDGEVINYRPEDRLVRRFKDW
jgi:ribonuclease P protein subunit POP4